MVNNYNKVLIHLATVYFPCDLYSIMSTMNHC